VSDQVNDLRDDRGDVNEFYKRYSAWLRMRVTRQCGRQDADDILQETWLRLTRYLGEHEVRHPRALLLRIAHNLVSNQSATRSRRTQQGEQATCLTAQPAVLPSQNEDLLMKELILCLPEPLRDRIVVGEMRDGAAALETLKSWNTGHPGGLSTLHANSAEDALRRIEDLAMEVVATPPRRTIGQAVDLIAHISRIREGRRLDAVLAVNGVSGDDYDIEIIG